MPEDARMVERGFEPAILCRGQDPLRPMNEGLESPSRYPQHKVGERQPKTRPPGPPWKAEHQHLPRVGGRRPGELWHVGVAAQDAVHDHDVGGFNVASRLSEVHELALNAILKAGPTEQVAGGLLIRRRQLNAHRSGDPRLEQFDLDSANTAANLKQREALHTLQFQELDDASSGWVEPSALVTPCFPPRSFLAERPPVAGRRAAVGHGLIIEDRAASRPTGAVGMICASFAPRTSRSRSPVALRVWRPALNSVSALLLRRRLDSSSLACGDRTTVFDGRRHGGTAEIAPRRLRDQGNRQRPAACVTL
jgi:hypothetical protein